MTMDKGEILRDYKSAKDKAAQVKILADLNDCTPAEIVGIIAGQIPSKRSISKLIKRYGCEPPVAQTPEHQIVPEPEPIMAVLEDREITVAEAVERLRREVEDLEKRRLEIDNERAELYSTLSDLLGVQSV